MILGRRYPPEKIIGSCVLLHRSDLESDTKLNAKISSWTDVHKHLTTIFEVLMTYSEISYTVLTTWQLWKECGRFCRSHHWLSTEVRLQCRASPGEVQVQRDHRLRRRGDDRDRVRRRPRRSWVPREF